MEKAEAPFDKIEATFEAVRTAVEERNYPALERALQEQRRLTSSAPPSASATQALILQGSALISWALTMVKIQHAGYAQELATILNTRHLNSRYADADGTRPELISLNA